MLMKLMQLNLKLFENSLLIEKELKILKLPVAKKAIVKTTPGAINSVNVGSRSP